MRGQQRRLAALMAKQVGAWDADHDHCLLLFPNQTKEEAIAEHETKGGKPVADPERVFWIEIVFGRREEKEGAGA